MHVPGVGPPDPLLAARPVAGRPLPAVSDCAVPGGDTAPGRSASWRADTLHRHRHVACGGPAGCQRRIVCGAVCRPGSARHACRSGRMPGTRRTARRPAPGRPHHRGPGGIILRPVSTRRQTARRQTAARRPSRQGWLARGTLRCCHPAAHPGHTCPVRSTMRLLEWTRRARSGPGATAAMVADVASAQIHLILACDAAGAPHGLRPGVTRATLRPASDARAAASPVGPARRRSRSGPRGPSARAARRRAPWSGVTSDALRHDGRLMARARAPDGP